MKPTFTLLAALLISATLPALDYARKPADPPYDRKPGDAKGALLPEALYDLTADVGETTDVIEQHPEVAARLRALAERMREDIGDSATNQKGKNRRPVGRVPVLKATDVPAKKAK